MRMGRVVAGMGLLLLTAVWAQAQDVDYAAAVAAAQKAGDLASLNRLCNEWIEAQPKDDRPRLILGRILLRLDKVDQAVEQFELAAEANPLSAAPRSEIGNVFLKAQKYAEAIKEYDQALQINRKHVPALAGKARAKLAQDKAAAALVDARAAVKAGPEDASANAVLGEVLLATGATEDALDAVRKAAELGADNADAWYSLGLCLDTLERPVEAQDAWQRFLELENQGERAVRVRHGWVVLDTTLFHPELKRDGHCGAFSPDGKHVAIVVQGRGIFRVPFQGEAELTPVVPGPDGADQQREISWSPDGSELLFYETFRGEPHRRALRVSATGGKTPTELAQPGIGGLEFPVWSPTGESFLLGHGMVRFVVDAATGAARKFITRCEDGKGLYCTDATFMPNGKELIVGGAPPKQGYDIYRLTLESGKATAMLWDCGKLLPGAVVTSPDGLAVAVTVYQADRNTRWPLMLISPSEPGVTVDLGLCRFPYGGPSWHPEGRRLLSKVNDFGQERLAIIRFGGLDPRPVAIAFKGQAGGGASVVISSKREMAQTVVLRWEAFGDHSLRLGPATESSEPVELKPGEQVEWPIELTPEQAESAVTVKVTVLNQDGVGAVKLVDWVAPSAR